MGFLYDEGSQAPDEHGMHALHREMLDESEVRAREEKSGEMVHVSSDGTRTKIKDMSNRHLLNTVRWIERQAQTGHRFVPGGGSDPDEMWLDEEVLFGAEALEFLRYNVYVAEARRRELMI